jgi:hypothetical protein
VAPSLRPHKAGARVYTARRDAGPLARRARAGERTAVEGPPGEEEAMRALRRARDEALRALQDAPGRLQAFGLRHARRYTGRATWHPAPLRWRSEGGCPTPVQPIVWQADVRAVTAPTERLPRLAQALHARGTAWRLPPVGAALQALRGVQGTVAVPPGAARGDLTRCEPPRARRQFLGRMPSAYARGARRRHGALPQAGPSPARRALVAGAWASRYPAHVRRPLQLRLEKPPKAIQAISWKAQGRLWKRYRTLIARGKHAHQGVVAMARELLGFRWAMAKESPVTP